jgi:hypothetical protein
MLHRYAHQDNSADQKNACFVVAEEILSEMQQGGLRTVSISVNRAYLNALLLLRKFDDYLNVTVDMMMVRSGIPLP